MKPRLDILPSQQALGAAKALDPEFNPIITEQETIVSP